MSNESPRVRLQPNHRKIINSICCIIALAERGGFRVSQYDILKSLFLADRSHLNKYGRPITFDNYVAMRAGPVPSLAYDLLKEHKPALDRYHLKHLPWKRSAPEPGSGRCYYSKPRIEDFDETLSQSDQELLRDALTIIRSLTFAQIRNLTHADPAYLEAWKDDAPRKSHPMSLGMLFDSPDFESAARLEFLSKQQ